MDGNAKYMDICRETVELLVDKLASQARRIAELEMENASLLEKNRNLSTTEAFWRERSEMML